MAAELHERAFQKQLGVNVGCVRRRAPRSGAKGARAREGCEGRSDRGCGRLTNDSIDVRRFASATKKKTPGKGGNRYYKNVGLGFKTPREAIEGA
jgi:hypothetical protein